VSRNLNFDLHFEAYTVLVLDVLRASEALKDATLNHDAHLGAQGFSFLHQVTSQNDSTRLLAGDLSHDRPHKAPGFWVHSCGGLIKQDDGRVADDSDSHGQLALVAARQSSRGLLPVNLKAKLVDDVVNQLLAAVGGDSLDASEILNVLLHG